LIVKLGTGVLTDARNRPDRTKIGQLVQQIAAQHRAGKELVLVSSGAVGAGMGRLEFSKRPTELAELQACAAVGQLQLMALYDSLFQEHNLQVAQVLLTHGDLGDHDRHLNARNTLVALLNRGILPIINENDAVSTTELKFGDNDRLSALVACLLPADLLIVLTTVDGVIENYGEANPRMLTTVETIDDHIQEIAQGTMNQISVGGMETKIEAARITVRSGIPMVIANGSKPDVLASVLGGREEGTLFIPRPSKMRGRKRWIAFFHHPRGSLVVDAGAAKALSEQGKSLLPPGIKECLGDFRSGEVISIRDLEGREFARGIAAFDANQIREGNLKRVVAVHRDNLSVL